MQFGKCRCHDTCTGSHQESSAIECETHSLSPRLKLSCQIQSAKVDFLLFPELPWTSKAREKLQIDTSTSPTIAGMVCTVDNREAERVYLSSNLAWTRFLTSSIYFVRKLRYGGGLTAQGDGACRFEREMTCCSAGCNGVSVS
jgi:hypothetical protein